MGPPAAHYAPSEPGVAGVATNACVALTATQGGSCTCDGRQLSRSSIDVLHPNLSRAQSQNGTVPVPRREQVARSHRVTSRAFRFSRRGREAIG